MIEGNEESMEMKRWKDFDRVRAGPQSCLSVAPVFYLSTFLYEVDIYLKKKKRVEKNIYIFSNFDSIQVKACVSLMN
jgi:hypothetical protein